MQQSGIGQLDSIGKRKKRINRKHKRERNILPEGVKRRKGELGSVEYLSQKAEKRGKETEKTEKESKGKGER